VLYLHEARNAMQAGFEQLSSQIREGFGQVSSPIFIMGSDWPHEQALARAREGDPQGLANLTRDLEDRDRAEHLSRLVRAPLYWMANLRAAVWEYIALLCDEAGLAVVSPRGPERRGGTVTVSTPDHAACHRELGERGIVCDFRPDPLGGIRLGPHFFNTEDEVRHAASELAEIVASGAYERHLGAATLF